MKIASLALLALSLLSGIKSDTSRPNLDHQHKATHRIVFISSAEGKVCSATAIGPHALLTAGHCFVPSNHVEIDSYLSDVVAIMADEHDHMIVIVAQEFTDYLSIEKSEPKGWVHMWGNPGHSHDVYRVGIFLQEIVLKGGKARVYELPTYPGDSGAAILSEDGNIIDVVSLGDNTSALGVAFPLNFSQSQLDEAQK